MIRALPFPKYSWQISQHEIVFNNEDILALLGSAQQFEGLSKHKYNSKLNAFIVNKKILTENVRSGVASPWRDYQQVLAELGLIVSTKLSNQLEITPIGHAFLAGNISFTAMLGTQLLRYQYPNGQKDKINKNDSISAHINSKVNIRPAVCLLKLLCELKNKNINEISLSQIANYVLPNKIDSEWSLSVSEINASNYNTKNRHPHATRNIRAWMKLLSRTKYFSIDTACSKLRLSKFVVDNFDDFCVHVDALLQAPKWDAQKNNKVDWFRFFGEFAGVAAVEKLEEKYQTEITAVEIDDKAKNTNSTISLIEFKEIDIQVKISENLDGEQLLKSFLDGQLKLAFSKSEHDKIVNTVAAYYKSRNFEIFHDLSSVDLYAVSPLGEIDIIEVKTINVYNVGKQIRTAFGQVLEYDYRLTKEGKTINSRKIVVNKKVSNDDWKVNFCKKYKVDLLDVGEFYLH